MSRKYGSPRALEYSSTPSPILPWIQRCDLNARRVDVPTHDLTPTLLSGCNPLFPASQLISVCRLLEVSRALYTIWLTEHSPRLSRLTKPLHLVQCPTHTHILHDGPPPQEARRTSPIKPTRRPTRIQTRRYENIEVQDRTSSCQRARRKSKEQRRRTKDACTYCHKRHIKCDPLDASNPFEPGQDTCVQCMTHSEECSRGQNQRVGSSSPSFYPGTVLLSLPNEFSEPLPEQYDHFDPFSQQHDPALTQSQSLPEPSSSPSSRALLQVDELLGYPEQKGWSRPAKEQSEMETYVRGTTRVKQEQTKTETEATGLGTYIPDAQPQYADVVEDLPTPLPTRLVDSILLGI